MKALSEQITESTGIKVSSGQISDWENGNKNPSADGLIALSSFFKTSVDWILTGKEGVIGDKLNGKEGKIRLEGILEGLAEAQKGQATEADKRGVVFSSVQSGKSATFAKIASDALKETHEGNMRFVHFFGDEWITTSHLQLDDDDRAEIEKFIDFLKYKKFMQQAKIKANGNDLIRERSAGIYAHMNAKAPEEFTELAPIWGEAAAGVPIESIRMFDGRSLRIPTKFKKCFAVKVKGDSMKDAGILDGGYAIVRSQQMVDDGDIALFMIENQATIKRFHLTDDNVTLISDNDGFEPMVFHRSREMQIVGKVVYYIRPEEAEIVEEWVEGK